MKNREMVSTKHEMISKRVIGSSRVASVMYDLLGVAGITQIPDEISVEIVEPKERLIKTKFRVEDAASAVLACVGTAVARLNGKPEKVKVDGLRAAASIRQDRYLLENDAKVNTWDPFSGVYQAGDGRFIQFHCNFQHHRDRMLKVLGLAVENCTREMVEEAVRKIPNVFEFEEELVHAGACASVVRTMDEWHQHDQFKAIKDLPLFEMVPVQTERHNRVVKSIEKLKCLDFSRVLAGPIGTRTFADFGAEVLRVSAPTLPFIQGCVWITGFGKNNTYLDLDNVEDQKELEKLLKKTNVLMNAYRPGCLNKFGMTAEDVAKKHPGIVIIELSAYGHTGPWATKRGYDSLVQCTSGLVDEHSKSIRSPTPIHLPVQFLDYVTGYLSAFAALSALAEIKQDPTKSFIIRLSLAQTAIWLENLGAMGNHEFMDAQDIPVSMICDLLLNTKLESGTTITTMDVPLQMTNAQPKLGDPPKHLGSHKPEWDQT